MKKVIIMLVLAMGIATANAQENVTVVTDNGSEQPTLTKEVYPQKEADGDLYHGLTKYKPSGFLEDQVATDYADHIIYCCYYNDQQFPVFCTDPAADIRWTKPQYRHDHVLHLLFCI